MANCLFLLIYNFRSDNSIEIWNLQGNPYQERTFLARLDYSVEALGWYQGRLFSTGLSGFLVEYCPYSFGIKVSPE